jgi:hypothetical protein
MHRLTAAVTFLLDDEGNVSDEASLTSAAMPFTKGL